MVGGEGFAGCLELIDFEQLLAVGRVESFFLPKWVIVTWWRHCAQLQGRSGIEAAGSLQPRLLGLSIKGFLSCEGFLVGSMFWLVQHVLDRSYKFLKLSDFGESFCKHGMAGYNWFQLIATKPMKWPALTCLDLPWNLRLSRENHGWRIRRSCGEPQGSCGNWLVPHRILWDFPSSWS